MKPFDFERFFVFIWKISLNVLLAVFWADVFYYNFLFSYAWRFSTDTVWVYVASLFLQKVCLLFSWQVYSNSTFCKWVNEVNFYFFSNCFLNMLLYVNWGFWLWLLRYVINNSNANVVWWIFTICCLLLLLWLSWFICLVCWFGG